MATLEERKKMLFNDPDLSVVEPHRVFCKRCDKWLKLDEVKLYAASVWRCHKNTKSHNARPPVSDGPSSAPAPSQEPRGGKNGRSVWRTSALGGISAARQARRYATSTSASPSVHTPRSQARLTIKIPPSLLRDNSAEPLSPSPVNGVNSVSKTSSYPSKPSSQNASRTKRRRESSSGAFSEDSEVLRPRSPPNQSKELPSDASFPYPENISPHRMASYKALLSDPFVEKLEPFRAYCTLCACWVPLSSRTPYSHGVWKGHVKNSEKHINASPVQYDDSVDHSPTRGEFRKTSRAYKGHDLTRDDGISPMDVEMGLNKPNPFALKAATENGFTARCHDLDLADSRAEDDLSQSEDDKNFARQSPQKKASLIALERRRQTIQLDPDAAIVEPRKVKCGICERWIKGSNTQEYSLHHWLKHKKKCLRNRKALLADKSELIEARKALLEADPDLMTIEPHRVFCNICNKWVKLCGRSRYSASHWFQHKKLCLAAQSGVQAVSSAQTTVTTAHDRRLALEADTDAMTVWPGRIQCQQCHQLVTIPSFPPFMPASWISHKTECFKNNDIPRKKVEKVIETRQEIMTADCHITNLTPHSFDCKVCNTSVELDKSLLYSLDQWDAHKRICGVINKRSKKDDVVTKVDEQSNVDAEAESTALPIDERPETNIERKTALDAAESKANADELKNKTEEEDVNMMCTSDIAVLPFQNEETLDDVKGPENLNNANSRLNYFLSQCDVFRIEPYRALCGNCLTWITLGTEAFSVQKWEAHKNVCRGPKSYKASDESQGTDVYGINTLKQALASRPKSSGSLPRKRLRSIEGGKRPQSPTILPPLPPRPRWPTEDERKQLFLEDEDVSKVEPHRLLCKICNCWIRLHPVIRYFQDVWPRHRAACRETTLQAFSGDARVRAKSEKEDKRRQLLEDDPYVTDITPHRVTCNACGTNIRLDTTYKYEGSHWRAHRARCPQIPFHDRSSKRRKRDSHLLNQAHEDDSQTGESSDSYDSDASSVLRPQPTSFFTKPLEVNPTKMFSSSRNRSHHQSRKDDSRHHAINKAKTDNLTLQHELEKIAEDLMQSGRLSEIINAADDGTAQITDFSENDAPSTDDTAHTLLPSENHPESEPKPPASPCLDIPRIMDSEVASAFDELFKSSTYAPQPSIDQTRVCPADKDSLPIMD